MVEFHKTGLDVTTQGTLVLLTATSNDGELIAQMQMEPKQAEQLALQMLRAAAEVIDEMRK